jgi:hypothetical protein
MSYKLLKVYDHVMSDRRLGSLQEKYLVCYVWSWQVQEKTCFVNESFLSSLLDLNYGDLHKLLASLKNRRILKENYGYAGTTRSFSVVIPGNEMELDQNSPDIFNL